MTRYIKLTRRFNAKSDSGKQYVVLEYQEYDKILTGDNNTNTVEGLKSWVTNSGLKLNKGEADKTFIITSNGDVIREV